MKWIKEFFLLFFVICFWNWDWIKMYWFTSLYNRQSHSYNAPIYIQWSGNSYSLQVWRNFSIHSIHSYLILKWLIFICKNNIVIYSIVSVIIISVLEKFIIAANNVISQKLHFCCDKYLYQLSAKKVALTNVNRFIMWLSGCWKYFIHISSSEMLVLHLWWSVARYFMNSILLAYKLKKKIIHVVRLIQ